MIFAGSVRQDREGALQRQIGGHYRVSMMFEGKELYTYTITICRTTVVLYPLIPMPWMHRSCIYNE